MNLRVKSNVFPYDGKLVAFMSYGKLRIGKIVRPQDQNFFVIEIETGNKFYPYTQELIEIGDNSEAKEIIATASFKELSKK